MDKEELLEHIQNRINNQLDALYNALWDEIIQNYQNYIIDEIAECLDKVEIEDNSLNNKVKEMMAGGNVAKISSAIENAGLKIISINKVDGQYVIKAN